MQRTCLTNMEPSLESSASESLLTDGLWSERAARLPSAEEQVTLITDSMTVTSTDQEKLLLLHKNTELRRINTELMKLNEELDGAYHSLQQRVEDLELENSAIKTLNNKLLLRVEHQQSVKDFYEHALMEEVKKKQKLYDYIRREESDLAPSEYTSTQGNMKPSAGSSVSPPEGPQPSPCSSPSWAPSAPRPQAELGGPGLGASAQGGPQQEVQDLQEQLQALQCQIQIYESEFQEERSSHKHTQQENRRLRQSREDMRQQGALLQQQLRLYEEDFRRERSDKQMLQRLLKKKQSPLTGPALIHRCNTANPPAEGDKRTHGDRPQQSRTQQPPPCPRDQRLKH